jgi:hypothetical protein
VVVVAVPRIFSPDAGHTSVVHSLLAADAAVDNPEGPSQDFSPVHVAAAAAAAAADDDDDVLPLFCSCCC